MLGHFITFGRQSKSRTECALHTHDVIPVAAISPGSRPARSDQSKLHEKTEEPFCCGIAWTSPSRPNTPRGIPSNGSSHPGGSATSTIPCTAMTSRSISADRPPIAFQKSRLSARQEAVDLGSDLRGRAEWLRACSSGDRARITLWLGRRQRGVLGLSVWQGGLEHRQGSRQTREPARRQPEHRHLHECYRRAGESLVVLLKRRSRLSAGSALTRPTMSRIRT